jgi:hypothetical protein
VLDRELRRVGVYPPSVGYTQKPDAARLTAELQAIAALIEVPPGRIRRLHHRSERDGRPLSRPQDTTRTRRQSHHRGCAVSDTPIWDEVATGPDTTTHDVAAPRERGPVTDRDSDDDRPDLDAIVDLVLAEWRRATAQFPPMASAHEGYAVLLEEVDELWDEVKANRPREAAAEAVQVAAMALRLLHDVYREALA